MQCHLIATIGGRFDLISAWLNYYKHQGIDNFLIILHHPNRAQNYQQRLITEQLNQHGIKPVHTWYGLFSERLRIEVEHHMISKHCNDNDWVFYADVDEFIAPPCRKLTALPNLCLQANKTYASGRLLDRISANGELTPAKHPLNKTYPLGGRLTKHILKACDNKIVCAQARERVGLGHHFQIGNRPIHWASLNANPERDFSHSIDVHHFKWVPETLENHKSTQTDNSQNSHQWTAETERLRQYINAHKAFKIQDASLEIHNHEHTLDFLLPHENI